MSATTIDERIVSMQFDNKKFESNVQTSINTLGNLKQSLDLSGAAKGLESVNTISRNMDFSPLANGVETVRAKFSALEVMAVTALANITNSAVNAGKRLIAAFTIDPIKTGFQEYELKMNSVQTIMASTGEDIETVNKYLNELNEYSDKTIYSFSDMTQNIGKFTNAGVSLEDAVLAMKGISNEAALSGANANEASRAMYNLSQAMSMGYVQYIDWKSIENANMATLGFKNQLLDTAVAMGTVKKAGDDTYKTLKGDTYNTMQMFKDGMKDQWLTSEVLVGTLKDYADETTDIGKKAYAAAQDVKTFTMMMDTLKEAAQSGWAQTWEIFIGDLEEAKALWTELSNIFGDILGKSAESRNKLLSGALDSNWEKLIGKITDAGIGIDRFEEKVTAVAKEHGVDLPSMITEYGSLEKAFTSGAVSANILYEAVNGLKGSLVDLKGIDGIFKKGSTGEDVEKLQKLIHELGYGNMDTTKFGIFGDKTEEAVKAFQEASGIKVDGIIGPETIEALEKASEGLDKLNSAADKASITALIAGITELGGREMLIDSLRNTLTAVGKVLTTIKDAFREVFPPMTAVQLRDIIEAIHEFSKRLIMSDENLDKLKRTFKGIFSVFKVVTTVIKSVIGAIVQLLGNFTGLGGSILDVTAAIGDWLSGLGDTVIETGVINEYISAFVGFLQKGIDKIKEIVLALKAKADELNIVGTCVDAVSTFLQTGIEKIKEFGTALKEKFSMPGFESFLTILGGIWEFIKFIGSKIASFGSSLGTALVGAFQSGDTSTLMAMIEGGTVVAIFTLIKDFIAKIKDVFGDAGGIVSSITGVLDSVKGCFQAWQTDLKADVLKKIATAIGILVVAIVVLTLIDPAKLEDAITAITILFTELMGSLALLGNMSGGLAGAAKVIGSLTSLSIAVLIMAISLKMIASLETDQIFNGLIGIFGICAIMVAALKMISGIDGMFKNIKSIMTGLILFGVAIKIVAGVVEDLGAMSMDAMVQGLIGVGVLMAAVSAFLNKTQFQGKAISTAVGMVIMAAAMKVFASAVSDFGAIDTGQLIKGIIAMGFVLGEISGFTKLTGGASGLISTGIGMVIIAAAMKVFASAVSDFGSMSIEQLAKGLIAMGIALYGVVGAMKLMPPNMISLGVGLLLVSAALTVMAGALTKLGGMSWKSVAKGLIALGGSLFALAIALNLMKGCITGAAALLIAAGALAVLTPVLMALGSMSLEQIAKALLTIAGVFIIFGIAGALLGPLAPTILALAGAVALFGIGCMAAGVGVLLVSAGLTALAASATAIAAAIVLIVSTVIGLIPTVVRAIGAGIIAFANVIAAGAPAIIAAIVAVVNGILLGLAQIGPVLFETIGSLISSLLTTIATYTPSIVSAGFSVLLAILQGIRDNIGEIAILAAEIIAEFILGISDGLPQIIAAGFELLLSLIKGLSDAIVENGEELSSAAWELVESLLAFICQFLVDGGETLWGAVQSFIQSGFVQGIWDKMVDAYNAVVDLVAEAIGAIGDWIDDIKEKGKEFAQGFINGIKEKAKDLWDAAVEMGKNALDGVANAIASHSPSRETMKLGRYFDEGFINGIKSYSGKARETAENLGYTTLNAMQKAISGASDMVNMDLSADPVIRPVLDLSDVEAGASSISGLFGMTPSVGIMADVGSISSMMDSRDSGNGDIISALKDLKNSIGKSSGNTYNVNGVTYDDGSNVSNAVQSLIHAAKVERRI